MKLFTVSSRLSFLYFVAVGLSIALSLWMNSKDRVINPDAICYLQSAEAIGKYGLYGAMHLCDQAKWPFYSLLIFKLVQTSHLSYTSSAYLINGFFSLLSVLAFITIARELGGSRRVLWLAALVILSAHDFNILRQDIIRDHGFWAFYLLSVFFLLRYFRNRQWGYAIFWSASLFIATLFRIEGALFLLILPFLSWLYAGYSWQTRLRCFIELNLLTLMTCLIIIGWLLLHPQHTLAQLGRLSELTNQLQHGLAMIALQYQTLKTVLVEHVLNVYSQSDTALVLFFMFIGWYLVSVITNLSWVYSFLVIYAWWRRAVSFSSSLVLSGYISVSALVTLAFLFEHLFLSKRYLIALSLILMFWVPFAVDDMLRKWQSKRYPILFPFVVLFIFISSLGGIVSFGYSKAYIRYAGDWLAEHVPAQATLYVNDYQLMYYSQHFGDSIFQKNRLYADMNVIANEQWKQYDYLALRFDKKEKEKMALVLHEIPLQPIQTFTNQRGDQINIYKVLRKEIQS